MLDIRFIRENPEIVKQNIRNKFGLGNAEKQQHKHPPDIKK